MNKISYDGFGFNNADDPYAGRMATLYNGAFKEEDARRAFGEFVVTAVNAYDQLQAENARLRERLKSMVYAVEHVLANADSLDGGFSHRTEFLSDAPEQLERARAALKGQS